MSIRKKLRKTGGKVLYLFHCLTWYLYYLRVSCGHKKANFQKNDGWYLNARLLLIAPHADDEILSSFTLLKNCPNISVYYCGFTGSNHSEENRRIRHDEIEKLCNTMKVPMIDGDGSCANLSEIVKEFDTIIIPSIVDWHPEHRKVSYMLYEILSTSKEKYNIYSYSVTVPIESNNTIIVNPMCNKEQDEKYDLFRRIYRSQKFMPIYRFRINERVNGSYTKFFSAEVFSYHPQDLWLQETSYIYHLERNQDGKLLSLIKSVGDINNLYSVRKASIDFYDFINSMECNS